MILLIGQFKVKQEQGAAFLEFAQFITNKSRQEMGNLLYGIYADLSTENAFVMLEQWQDQQAFDAHQQTPQFARFRAEFSGYLDGNADFKMHTIG